MVVYIYPPQNQGILEKAAETHTIYVFCLLMFLTLATVAVIYRNRGFGKVVAIFTYIMSLALMSTSLKDLYGTGYHHVMFICAIHFLATALVGLCLLKCRTKGIVIPGYRSLLYGILPISLANAGSIIFANHGILYCDVHFYEMMTSGTLLVTAAIGYLLGRHIHAQLWFPLSIFTAGLVIVSFGEVVVNLTGTLFIFLGMVLGATKSQLQSMLMRHNGWQREDKVGETFDALELSTWSAIGCLFVSLMFSLWQDGMKPWVDLPSRPHMSMRVLMSAMFACAINIVGMVVMKELGPVGQQVAGQLKGTLACVASVTLLMENITPRQIFGYATVMLSIFWYNHTDAELRRQEELEPLMKASCDMSISEGDVVTCDA